MDMSPWCPQICKTSHNVIGKLLRSQSSPSMSPSFDGHVGEILPDSQASLDMGKYLYIPIEPMGLERYLQLFTGICRYSLESSMLGPGPAGRSSAVWWSSPWEKDGGNKHRSYVLQLCNVVKAKINHPLGNGVYNPCMVMTGGWLIIV